MEAIPFPKFSPKSVDVPFVKGRKRILDYVIACQSHKLLIVQADGGKECAIREYIESIRVARGGMPGVQRFDVIADEARAWR